MNGWYTTVSLTYSVDRTIWIPKNEERTETFPPFYLPGSRFKNYLIYNYRDNYNLYWTLHANMLRRVYPTLPSDFEYLDLEAIKQQRPAETTAYANKIMAIIDEETARQYDRLRDTQDPRTVVLLPH